MDKNITKARQEILRYFFTLKDIEENKGELSSYREESFVKENHVPHPLFRKLCLCAQGQVVKKFINKYSEEDTWYGEVSRVYEFQPHFEAVTSILGISFEEWAKIENLFEGRLYCQGNNEGVLRHSFKSLATWMQKQPGWPTVL